MGIKNWFTVLLDYAAQGPGAINLFDDRPIDGLQTAVQVRGLIRDMQKIASNNAAITEKYYAGTYPRTEIFGGRSLFTAVVL